MKLIEISRPVKSYEINDLSQISCIFGGGRERSGQCLMLALPQAPLGTLGASHSPQGWLAGTCLGAWHSEAAHDAARRDTRSAELPSLRCRQSASLTRAVQCEWTTREGGPAGSAVRVRVCAAPLSSARSEMTAHRVCSAATMSVLVPPPPLNFASHMALRWSREFLPYRDTETHREARPLDVASHLRLL